MKSCSSRNLEEVADISEKEEFDRVAVMYSHIRDYIRRDEDSSLVYNTKAESDKIISNIQTLHPEYEISLHAFLMPTAML